MTPLRYLDGYPAPLLESARVLLAQGRALEYLANRYPDPHAVRSDGALANYVGAMKARHLRTAPPLSKVVFDSRMHVVQQALGTHTVVSRVQGRQLKAKRELRVARLFIEAPAAFLRMIVIHELAHLREREHGKAFYALCLHMDPEYHQLEFDTRLWLAARETSGPAPQRPATG